MRPGSVAEVRGRSSTSIEDAIKRGIAGLDETLQNVRCLWMKAQRVHPGVGSAVEYEVDLWITFVGDDWQAAV